MTEPTPTSGRASRGDGSYDTSGPGGFYWGEMHGLLAAPINTAGFREFDQAAADELVGEQIARLVALTDSRPPRASRRSLRRSRAST